MWTGFEIARELKETFAIAVRRGPLEVDLGIKKVNVLGIPGFGSGIAGWLDGGLLTYVQKKGFGGIMLGLGKGTDRIDSFLPKVREHAINLPKNSFAIGFSMEGLILLKHLQTHGWGNIDTAITIATPLNGAAVCSPFAFAGGAIADLAPSNPLLEKLRSTEPPKEKRLVHILLKGDEFVGSPDKIICRGEKIVAPFAGHNYVQYQIVPLLEKTLDGIIGV